MKRNAICLNTLPMFLVALLGTSIIVDLCSAQQEKGGLIESMPAEVRKVLTNYCESCHGAEKQEGDFQLNALHAVSGESRNELLLKMQEVVRLGEMPPKEAKQPDPQARKKVDEWVSGVLKSNGLSTLDEKLQRPEFGNLVNHEKLFSGEYSNLPAFTFDRRWLISQYIFEEKFNRILKHLATQNIDGKRQSVVGSNNRRVNLTNPFLLPLDSGVRYYANETLNGGHLLTMLTNAKEVADYMMYLAQRDQRYLPSVTTIMALENQQKITLENRKRFLGNHVERILQDVFKARHEDLLPKFVRVQVAESNTGGGSTKKAPFHAANPGQQELVLIFRSMRRQRRPEQTDEELIEACEKEWFYFGHNERKIQARITFLNNYMEEWRAVIKQHRYEERNKPVVYRPLSDDEMAEIERLILRLRGPGDRYNQVIEKCIADWETRFEKERMAAGLPPKEQVNNLINELFLKILERAPTEEETVDFSALANTYVESLGRRGAIEKLIQTLILNTEFVYRNEFGVGVPDRHGRRMMSPRDASYAIAYALTDSSPDAELARAAKENRLNERKDYEREVRRMLSKRDQYYIIDEAVNRPNDLANFTNMPIRELRFIREFFGYPKLMPVFKDNKRFGANYDAAKRRLVTEADRLVEFILEQDQDVIEELLTTKRFYVFHTGDNKAMKSSSDRIARIYGYFKDLDWQNFTVEDLAKHKEFISEVKMRGIDVNRLTPGGRYNPLGAFKKQLASFTLRLENGQKAAAPYNSFPAHGMANAPSRYGGRLQSPEVAKFFDVDMAAWDYETTQPVAMPNRSGILTHPAWLIAFAHNTETDPIRRGKWIREKLLAGTIPNVPITVDAVVPEDPQKTLRQRMEIKTSAEYCWKCHQKMEPLGLPFEIYDDFGRYRTRERLEYPENLVKKVKDKGEPHEDLRDVYKTLPVDSTGELIGTGDPTLDGKVKNAIDLIERLGKSQRVRQSIIRHAFRYFLGRNEKLSDSKTLMDAERAYLESGGSFDEVIVSLLTSDSFIYRMSHK